MKNTDICFVRLRINIKIKKRKTYIFIFYLFIEDSLLLKENPKFNERIGVQIYYFLIINVVDKT